MESRVLVVPTTSCILGIDQQEREQDHPLQFTLCCYTQREKATVSLVPLYALLLSSIANCPKYIIK